MRYPGSNRLTQSVAEGGAGELESVLDHYVCQRRSAGRRLHSAQRGGPDRRWRWPEDQCQWQSAACIRRSQRRPILQHQRLLAAAAWLHRQLRRATCSAGPVKTSSIWPHSKILPFIERVKIQFRSEFYNAFNHTQFSGVDTTARFDLTTGAQTNPTFGQANADRGGRMIQMALRLSF